MMRVYDHEDAATRASALGTDAAGSTAMATLSSGTGSLTLPTTALSPKAAAHTGETQVKRSDAMRWVGPATALAPALGLSIGAYLAFGTKRRGLGLGTLGSSVAFALARWQLARLFTERTRYVTERRIGALEVRRYALTVRAETRIENANWADALNQGFKRVAGYIFGGNRSRIKIQMTAPVIVSIGETDRGDRNVAFIMPSDRPLAELPIPSDLRIHLYEVPPQRVAALSFRGRYGGELPLAKRTELLRLVHQAGLTTFGDVYFAGYDAPSTLPLFRRNEVLVRITE
jgi:hypothetical protein